MRKIVETHIILFLILVLFLNGCATLRTVPHFTLDTPKLYSGTRMDLDAMKQSQDYILRKFNAEATSHPYLDLPFSFFGDTVVLFPVTLPIAIGQALFEG